MPRSRPPARAPRAAASRGSYGPGVPEGNAVSGWNSALPAPASTSRAARLARPCNEYRVAAILIVDDESSARSTLRLLLRTRGHEVREADGVTRALTALATAPVDLVVTDLRLPDGQGLEVLQAAKTRWPDTQVILLTAYAGWESAKHAIQLGAFDYVEKAQEPEALFARIDAALREQAVRRAAGPAASQLTARAGPEGERCVLTVLFADLQRSGPPN